MAPHISARGKAITNLRQPERNKTEQKKERKRSENYILTMSFSSSTVSSVARGEKWHTVLFTDKHVGKATPLSIFFFAFLYIFPVCLAN
jgi:hypothetical protein